MVRGTRMEKSRNTCPRLGPEPGTHPSPRSLASFKSNHPVGAREEDEELEAPSTNTAQPRRNPHKRTHLDAFTSPTGPRPPRPRKRTRIPQTANLLQRWLANGSADQAEDEKVVPLTEPRTQVCLPPARPSHARSTLPPSPSTTRSELEEGSEDEDWEEDEGDEDDTDIEDDYDPPNDNGNGPGNPPSGGSSGSSGKRVHMPTPKRSCSQSGTQPAPTGVLNPSGACYAGVQGGGPTSAVLPPTPAPYASPPPLLMPPGTSHSPLLLSAHLPPLSSLFCPNWDLGHQLVARKRKRVGSTR